MTWGGCEATLDALACSRQPTSCYPYLLASMFFLLWKIWAPSLKMQCLDATGCSDIVFELILISSGGDLWSVNENCSLIVHTVNRWVACKFLYSRSLCVITIMKH